VAGGLQARVLKRLIVRLPNWLGDTVMAVPALRALRASVGDGRILLAGPWAPILAGQGLAEVLVVYPRGWGGRLRAADEVRKFGADTAVLLPNSLEAALAAVYWGARRRIGYAWGGRSRLLTDPVPPPRPRFHQVDEYARLVGRLDVPVTERVPRLQPPDARAPGRLRGRELLEEVGARGGRGPVVGVHLGAAFGNAKVWARERIVEFCRALLDAGGSPVLLGAPEDAPFAEAVRADTRAPSLAGRDSPELLPALLAELDALVAGDTGVAHLAAALGTPVVALFGPTDPAFSAPRGPVAVLTHPVPCAPCFYRVCPIDHLCMRLITAERVRERVETLLGARR
jgi:heptosyltransferase-2